MSGDGSTLFSRLHADGYGAPALKWSCLLRHVRGVVWTISQSAEGNKKKGKKMCLGSERDGERQSEREE